MQLLVDSICQLARRTLELEQKKTDYCPAEGAANEQWDGPTAACVHVCKFLQEELQELEECLDGVNLLRYVDGPQSSGCGHGDG